MARAARSFRQADSIPTLPNAVQKRALRSWHRRLWSAQECTVAASLPKPVLALGIAWRRTRSGNLGQDRSKVRQGLKAQTQCLEGSVPVLGSSVGPCTNDRDSRRNCTQRRKSNTKSAHHDFQKEIGFSPNYPFLFQYPAWTSDHSHAFFKNGLLHLWTRKFLKPGNIPDAIPC